MAPRARFNVLFLLPVFALLLIAAVWSLTAWRSAHEHDLALTEAFDDTDAFTRLFAERTRRVLREIDQATRFLKLEFERLDPQGARLDLADYTRRQGLLPTDVTVRISIADSKGNVVDSNLPYAVANLADRDYFKAHVTDTADGLKISSPLQGRGIKRVIVALTRRLNHADGSFAGVIVVAVGPDYLTGGYDANLLLTRGVVALLGTDGRFRAARIGDAVLDTEPPASPTLVAWAKADAADRTIIGGSFDGERRMLSHQPVLDFPLIAIAGISEEEALRGFHRRRDLYIVSAGVVSALTLAATALLMLMGFHLQASRLKDREASDRLRLITDHMPVLIAYVDPEKRIRFANQAYRDWFGAEPQSLVGRSLLEFYGAETYKTIRPHMDAALAGTPIAYERKFDTITGQRDASVSAVPHRDDKGNVIGLYVMTTDITVQRAMMLTAIQQDEAIALARRRGIEQELALKIAKQSEDAAQQANLAKSAFLATMSHEIRTPMNGVIGMIDVLAQSSLSVDQADIVATVRTSALSLLVSIDAILDFSKIEAGALDLERCVVELPELVKGVCNNLGPGASGRGVTVQLFVDPNTPEFVWGDPTRLRQVLYNLVGNAIKFSSGRLGIQGVVSVRVEVASAAPLQLAFVVKDNGIGISPDALARLFKPFVQAEAATTRRFGGTGLGLVISKRLVELMLGSIAVQSEANAGCTFTVTLPFEVAPAPLASDIPDVAVASTAGGDHVAHGLILVAEDDEVSRKVISRQLALLGYQAQVVSDGAQALGLWRSGDYAMLITDLHMPEMDGYSLAAAVRSEEKARGPDELGRIPILALTANAQHEEAARIRLVGMDDRLTKPIQLAVLRAALTRWFPRPEV